MTETDVRKSKVNIKIQKKRGAGIGLAALFVLLALVAAAWVYGQLCGGVPENEAYFYFFDVGQADAAAVVTHDGCILIDAGSNASEEKLLYMLRSAGIKHIDLAIFSHPHEDHIGGADFVLENIAVDELLMPDGGSGEDEYRRLCNAAARKNIKNVTAYDGYSRVLGGLNIEVLSSGGEDENEASTVVRVAFGKTVAVFTGDAGIETEKSLMKKYPRDKLECDILKVGHHGSLTATCREWAELLSPDYAVVSCSGTNTFGHPDYRVLRLLRGAGANICRTDTDGTVLLISDGQNVRIGK